MTIKTTRMGARGIEKMPGWFSWRHQGGDAHEEASREYRALHGRDARKARADERNAELVNLSDAARAALFASRKANYDASMGVSRD